ncbi:MAG: nickel pincer cofactor biosynthesis protein LarC [Candidatus Schekmanbacteria bacterium]|nr:nickel pincer cofactor biosynthesis protein LarC [Candidatus Schekmanbacteria bacterium]
MKCAYFDCFSGASGDMILGALLDLGVTLEQLEQNLSRLPISGYQLTAERVKSQGISATHLKIEIDQSAQPLRYFSHIREIIGNCGLPAEIKAQSLAVLQRLAEAEAKIHAIGIEQVHFHEIGAVDTIIDVVGSIVGLNILGVDEILCSPLALGYGQIKCAHGNLPVPAPATLELLKNCPVYGGDVPAELVTPTGAAIISTLAKNFSAIPLMQAEKIGYGAGSRDYSPHPNLLRLIIGERNGAAATLSETLAKLEADIDDMEPQLYAYIMEQLMVAGALDVTLTPIYMKKNRPAVRLSAFAPPHLSQKLAHLILQETTTIGLRISQVQKMMLTRQIKNIETPWGTVTVKICRLPNQKVKFKAEYEDCKKIAQTEGICLQEVYRQVQILAEKQLVHDFINN